MGWWHIPCKRAAAAAAVAATTTTTFGSRVVMRTFRHGVHVNVNVNAVAAARTTTVRSMTRIKRSRGGCFCCWEQQQRKWLATCSGGDDNKTSLPRRPSLNYDIASTASTSTSTSPDEITAVPTTEKESLAFKSMAVQPAGADGVVVVDAHPLVSAIRKKKTSTSIGTTTGSSTNTPTTTTPTGSSQRNKVSPRLPMVSSLEEFPPDRSHAWRKQQAVVRILKIAAQRLIEPPTLHLMVFTAWATMGIASVEGILLCQQWPWIESMEAGKFVWWYSIYQLVPSIVWDSADATLVAQSLNLDPTTVLRDLSLSSGDAHSASSSATTLLRIHFLSSTRYFVAGFVMIASIVRAAGVSAGAFAKYEERIRSGREPPLELLEQPSSGVVIRLCGRDSYTTQVSLQTMGVHIFPVFEQFDRVQHLLSRHSEGLHRPVYWCVREGTYGSADAWDRFPADPSMLIPPSSLLWNYSKEQDAATTTSSLPKLLILEADGTNPHDPLALGNAALDLNLDDASQGFRRIQERFTLSAQNQNRTTTILSKEPPSIPFRTLRVYLGNSLEIARTGGGHAYTLRHRVRYTKEMDVLIDSRAPVLERILDWCRRVAGDNRQIYFQTSSPEYFTSLQTIFRCYGYEIHDPLDLRASWQSTNQINSPVISTTNDKPNPTKAAAERQQGKGKFRPSPSQNLMEDPLLYDMWDEIGMKEILDAPSSPLKKYNYETATTISSSTPTLDSYTPPFQQQQQPQAPKEPLHRKKNSEMLRHVARMAKLPRLVHMPTTAETVNAVEALITAGEVDATNCCAILERQEGVEALEYIIRQKSVLVRGERHQEWIQDTEYLENEPAPSAKTNQKQQYINRWAESRRHLAGGGAGLQIICTSTIYDDLFRQVRMWARMGFTSAQIQKEIDLQFHEILDYSQHE